MNIGDKVRSKEMYGLVAELSKESGGGYTLRFERVADNARLTNLPLKFYRAVVELVELVEAWEQEKAETGKSKAVVDELTDHMMYAKSLRKRKRDIQTRTLDDNQKREELSGGVLGGRC